MDKIFVHENYTATGSKANDIALLRLGDNNHISEKQELLKKKKKANQYEFSTKKINAFRYDLKAKDLV